MPSYSADPASMRSLAARLAACASVVHRSISGAQPILVAHGHPIAATETERAAVGLDVWSESWITSLHDRAAILERPAPSPVSRHAGTVASDLVRWALTDTTVTAAGEEDRLGRVGRAMLEGTPPEDAGLGTSYFPETYVAAHRRHRHIVEEIEEVRAALIDTWNELAEARATGLAAATDPALAAALDDLDARLRQLEAELENVRGSLVAPLPEVAAHVAGLQLVAAETRERLVAELLAAEVMAFAGNVAAMIEASELVATYVTTPAAAVVFFEALPDWAPPGLVAASGIGPHQREMRLRFIEPFAEALAMASGDSSGIIAAGTLVDHADAGYWFAGSHDFSTAFLTAAGAAAAANARSNPTWSFETIGTSGATVALDPRVMILEQLAAAGPVAVAQLVIEMRDAGDLGELLDPAVAYGDAGGAAGTALAVLGTSLDARVIGAVAAVIDVTGSVTPDAPVLRGLALMVAPHLPALASPGSRTALPQTPLSAALDAHPAAESAVAGLLAKVLDDPAAAETMFSAFMTMLAAAVTHSFDPTDPQSINQAFWEAGALADDLVSTYLQVELAGAHAEDAAAAIWQWIVTGALDFVAGAGAASLGPAGLAGVVAESLTGLALSGAVAPNERGSVESVLLDGYALDAGLVDAGVLIVLQLLDAADVVALPRGWFEDGRVVPPAAEELEAFLDELEASGFPVWDWLLAPMAIAGATIGDGSPEH